MTMTFIVKLIFGCVNAGNTHHICISCFDPFEELIKYMKEIKISKYLIMTPQ